MALVLDERERRSFFPGNFGAIRLLMACLVIIGHTPELIDGDRHRELLTLWFGGISFGEAAVDGFFLISGYMLALSVEKSGSLSNYFIKRVARIYPAFIVSFLICIAIVNPLAGGSWDLHELITNCLRLALLQPPQSQTAFVGAPYPALNGAMWTISYEFCCYILLAIIFAMGLLSRRWLLVGAVVLLHALLLTRPHLDLVRREITFGGGAQNTLRFVTAFCTGVVYRKTLSPQRLSGWLAIGCVVILPLALSNRFLAEPGLIFAGGYLLIYIGETRLSEFLSRIGQQIDLSYGIYLYAWPVQSLAIWTFGVKSVLQIDILTVVVCSMLALLSWMFIERPAMRAAIKLTRRSGSKAIPMVVEDAGAP